MIAGKNVCSWMNAAMPAMARSILSAGAAGAGGDRLQALGGEREHLAQQRAVEALLALEVVVEHRLVDPGAAGDAVDARAGEAALGEFEGGGGEDRGRARRGQGGPYGKT